MNTLEKIVSSKVRAAFFRILFGISPQELHLREIQRRSGLAIETVRKEAVKLETLGIIQKRRDGNRTYFKANMEHPIYKEIHQLVVKTSGLADILRKALTIDDIHFAFVFGSIANGNANIESDIDLFIIGETTLRQVSNMLKEPSLYLGRKINSHVMTLKEFIRRKSQGEHFVNNVLQSQKLMIIGTEHELAAVGQ